MFFLKINLAVNSLDPSTIPIAIGTG